MHLENWVQKQRKKRVAQMSSKPLNLPQVPLECINTSFALPFHSRLRHGVDIIVFNPPYVPTVEDEASGAQHGRDIQGSWAGGSDGMQVTEHFLHMVHVRHNAVLAVVNLLTPL